MAIDPVTAALDIGGKLIDRLWPDPTERDKAKLELLKLQQEGELKQLTAELDLARGQQEVNEKEAQHERVFVSGWRPFIGWICGLGLCMQFLVGPFVTWAAQLFGKVAVFPSLDMGTLLTLLMGMLGIAGMRTYEKFKGVANQ